MSVYDFFLYFELGYRNSAQTAQLNGFFLTSADLLNGAGLWQNTDWLLPNIICSGNVVDLYYCSGY